MNTFKLANFSLSIPQGHHETSGHVRLGHGTQYSLQLRNDDNRPCDALVKIDGKEVGCWRIPAGSEIELERPVSDSGRFTFYRLGSPEADLADLVEGFELGLVAVTFMPKLEFVTCVRFSPCRGGTGLSGESTQQLSTVSALNYDRGAFVTIFARLYCDVRPLRGVGWASAPPPLPGAGL
jgi:hypothetical protein